MWSKPIPFAPPYSPLQSPHKCFLSGPGMFKVTLKWLGGCQDLNLPGYFIITEAQPRSTGRGHGVASGTWLWRSLWREEMKENPETISPSSGGVVEEPPSHYPLLLPTHLALHILDNGRPRNGENKMRDDSSQLFAEEAGEWERGILWPPCHATQAATSKSHSNSRDRS